MILENYNLKRTCLYFMLFILYRSIALFPQSFDLKCIITLTAPYPTTAGENLRLYNSNNVTVRPRASVSTNFVQTITSFERTGGHWKDMLASKKLTTTKASSTTKSLNHHSSNAVQVVSSKNPFSGNILYYALA